MKISICLYLIFGFDETLNSMTSKLLRVNAFDQQMGNNYSQCDIGKGREMYA